MEGRGRKYWLLVSGFTRVSVGPREYAVTRPAAVRAPSRLLGTQYRLFCCLMMSNLAVSATAITAMTPA